MFVCPCHLWVICPLIYLGLGSPAGRHVGVGVGGLVTLGLG